MKKIKIFCAVATILFCIDYAMAILLNFSLLYDYAQNHITFQKWYAFFIGVCGFIHLQSFSQFQEDDSSKI